LEGLFICYGHAYADCYTCNFPTASAGTFGWYTSAALLPSTSVCGGASPPLGRFVGTMSRDFRVLFFLTVTLCHLLLVYGCAVAFPAYQWNFIYQCFLDVGWRCRPRCPDLMWCLYIGTDALHIVSEGGTLAGLPT
jgi:hypothetical protein